jgi:C4-dicarboxylate-specific signal transduction histidine kinase
MHAVTVLANGGDLEKTPSPHDERRGPHHEYIALGADIQDSQGARVEARHRQLALARLNRIASVAVLSASIAHELNQPLAAMLSNVEAAELCLEANPPDLAIIREILADIRRDDLRAADVVRNMRGLLTRDEFEFQDVDLNDVVSAAHDILAPRAADLGVALKTEKVEHSLPVRVNPVHLQQVLLNLALNGFDAMSHSPPHDRRMVLQTTMPNECIAQASVSDSGSGIPTDRLERIFEPFFTTKPQGTGVGLSISREIIEACGGTIWAENRHAGGAVFHFTLPLTRAAPS